MTATQPTKAPTGRQAPAPGRPPVPPARPARPASTGGAPGGEGPVASGAQQAGPPEPVLYFAYGSNLDQAQMRRRCPTAAPIGPATLYGWRLAFGGHSRTWGGSVATLVRSAGARVDGVLYALPTAELSALDRCEGHPGCYRRRLITVTTRPAGHRRQVQTYVRPVALEEPPGLGYFTALWLAYRALGFDHEPLLAAASGGVR